MLTDHRGPWVSAMVCVEVDMDYLRGYILEAGGLEMAIGHCIVDPWEVR